MAQNQTPETKKTSNYVMIIIFIVVALSIVSLILAAYAFSIGESLAGGVYVVIGLVALTMSMFTLDQSRRQAAEMKIEIPKVMTTVECMKCGTKTVREFQRGDYVFKELGECPKCPGTKQTISAVYKEVKEKEKVYPV